MFKPTAKGATTTVVGNHGVTTEGEGGAPRAQECRSFHAMLGTKQGGLHGM